MLDWGLDAQAAAALPNFGSRNGPTELEAGTAVVELAPKLRALGADVSAMEMTSGAQAIKKIEARQHSLDTFAAKSASRRRGRKR